jgi:hypothetical protein
MKRFLNYAICLIAANFFLSANAQADIVLTFDQSGASNFTSIDQDYGDRVVASPDANGHVYDIVPDVNLLTPNVEVAYNAGGVGIALWTSGGYGDLDTVIFAGDFATELEIDFTADAGFEVGLAGFDLAAFSSSQTIQGVEVTDGDDNVLFSVGSTLISGVNRNSFDTSGIFADSLTIAVDLTGLGSGADNIAIDNIQFSQRPISAIPEPASASIVLLGLIGLASRRKR